MPTKDDAKFAEVVLTVAKDLKEDLLILKGFDFDLPTDNDLALLQTLADKYGIAPPAVEGGGFITVNEINFIKVIGDLGYLIREKLESLAVENVLESERAKDPGRKLKNRSEPGKVPRVAIDGLRLDR